MKQSFHRNTVMRWPNVKEQLANNCLYQLGCSVINQYIPHTLIEMDKIVRR